MQNKILRNFSSAIITISLKFAIVITIVSAFMTSNVPAETLFNIVFPLEMNLTCTIPDHGGGCSVITMPLPRCKQETFVTIQNLSLPTTRNDDDTDVRQNIILIPEDGINQFQVNHIFDLNPVWGKLNKVTPNTLYLKEGENVLLIQTFNTIFLSEETIEKVNVTSTMTF